MEESKEVVLNWDAEEPGGMNNVFALTTDVVSKQAPNLHKGVRTYIHGSTQMLKTKDEMLALKEHLDAVVGTTINTGRNEFYVAFYRLLNTGRAWVVLLRDPRTNYGAKSNPKAKKGNYLA
jgi:hypothetical protein